MDRWDYELNELTPSEIGFAANRKFWFKCPRGIHESRAYSPNNLIHKGRTAKCPQCESIGQFIIDTYGENGIEMYWSTKNKVDPFLLRKGSREKAWFKCTEKEYHEDYLMPANNFYNGQRCPYCNSVKIHPKDSFAQWCIDNIDKDFLNKYWSPRNTLDPFKIAKRYEGKIYIKCTQVEYHEDYETTCSRFVAGKRCPFCAGKKVHRLDSVAVKYPIILEYWSSKNAKTPYEYLPKSWAKVWFNCKKHGEYKSTISSFTNSIYHCPKCANENIVSSYQKMVNEFLDDINISYLREYNCNLKPVNPKTGHILPYDVEIPAHKMIIEINGMQHYKICGITKLNASSEGISLEESLKYTQWKDEYKRKYAIDNGYNYLAIPYTAFNDSQYKRLIMDELNKQHTNND